MERAFLGKWNDLSKEYCAFGNEVLGWSVR